MKQLLLGVVLLCLVGFMACEDIVIGDYPSTRVGDTVYVFPQADDYFRVAVWRDGCNVEVNRPYDDQTTIEFDEYYDGEILHETIVKRP